MLIMLQLYDFSSSFVPFCMLKNSIYLAITELKVFSIPHAYPHTGNHMNISPIPHTCKPSMASLRMEGVNLEACLKEKLLQSIIRMKPFI